jgi:hypothetical protein
VVNLVYGASGKWRIFCEREPQRCAFDLEFGDGASALSWVRRSYLSLDEPGESGRFDFVLEKAWLLWLA